MIVEFKNSKIEFKKKYPSGTEIEIHPGFINSDYPVSGGWYITNSGQIKHLDEFVGKCGVSSMMSVNGISKIKITGAYGNIYSAQWAFFNASDEIFGTSPMVTSSSGDYEANVPAGVEYVRFGQNISSSGLVRSCILKFVVA